MKFETSYLLNNGIYTVPDASRFSKVSSRRIRYWLQKRGTEKESEGKRTRLWAGQIKPIEDKFALGFLDLQEIRFVNAFLLAGVSWPTLREAHLQAKTLYRVEHPFCTHRFVTDGRDIFDSLLNAALGQQLTDIVRGQRVFPQVVTPFLKELKFSASDEIQSWWPLGTEKKVVLDPTRQFGQPTTAHDCVPTEVLYLAVKAGQSVEEVAAWYEIDLASTQDAYDFELSLRA